MKQVFFLICFSFLLSFAAMAESPPDIGQATDKIEMNLHAQDLTAVSPDVANVVQGNLFQPAVEIQNSAPALPHGNYLRSCGQENANLISTCKKVTTSTEAKAPTNTNADFKVGWQGEGVKIYMK